MKIAIDYRLAAVSSRGMARYAREITECLVRDYPEEQWMLLVTKEGETRIMAENPRMAPYLQVLPHGGIVLAEQWGMAATVQRLNADVLWCPYNTMPLLGLQGIKVVVTVHDLIFMDPIEGGTLYQRLGALYRRLCIRKVTRRADRLLTVSRFTGNEMTRVLGVPPSRWRVTYNKVDSMAAAILARGAVKRDDFFFTLSGDAPHKNLDRLMDWFSRNPSKRLLVAGVPRDSKIRQRAPRNVIILGRMTDEELADLYVRCKAFVFLSLKEGFGLPVAEAMAARCPMLLSDRHSIPEVAGSLGVYVNPEDDESINRGFQEIENQVIDEKAFSESLARFVGWDESARIVHEAMID